MYTVIVPWLSMSHISIHPQPLAHERLADACCIEFEMVTGPCKPRSGLNCTCAAMTV